MSLWQWRVKLLMSNEKDYLEFRCPEPCGALMCKYCDTQEPFAVEIKCQKRSCTNINTKSNCVPTKIVELRCEHIDKKKSERWGNPTVCNKLLARIIPGTDIEIKCPRCKGLTYSLKQFPKLLSEDTYE